MPSRPGRPFEHIHLVPGDALGRYQEKRRFNLTILGAQMRFDLWLPPLGIREIIFYAPTKPWVAFHSWHPGLIALDEDEVMMARALFAGTADPEAARPMREIFDRLGFLAPGEASLGAVTLRAIIDFAALQNPWELERFLEIIQRRRPQTIVEIGTSTGGLLYALAQTVAPDATIVSIDVPESFDSAGTEETMCQVLPSLVNAGQTLHLVRGRSDDANTSRQLAEILAGRAIDLLVIDGDHSLAGVRTDHERYAPLVASGGLIAFHDILVRPDNSGPGFEVGLYWAELSRIPGSRETIVDPNGVAGILAQDHLPLKQRRPTALGFGLIYP